MTTDQNSDSNSFEGQETPDLEHTSSVSQSLHTETIIGAGGNGEEDLTRVSGWLGQAQSPSVVAPPLAEAIEFRVVREGAPTRRLRLSGARYTFGNGDGCSICLDDPSLGSLHAVLIREDARVIVRAYSIPIEVNGNRTTEVTLEIGDVMKLGEYSFELLSVSATGEIPQRDPLSHDAPSSTRPPSTRDVLQSTQGHTKHTIQPRDEDALGGADQGHQQPPQSVGAFQPAESPSSLSAGDMGLGRLSFADAGLEVAGATDFSSVEGVADSMEKTQPSPAFPASQGHHPAEEQVWRDRLRREVDAWRKRQDECDRLAQQCHDRESELHRRETELWNRAERLQSREASLRAQESAAIEIQREYSAQQQEVERLRGENERVTNKLKHRDEEIHRREEEYRQQAEEASIQLQQSREQAESASQAVQRMREQLAALNRQLEELSNQQQALEVQEKQRFAESQQQRLDWESARDLALSQRDVASRERDEAIDARARVEAELSKTRSLMESSESKLSEEEAARREAETRLQEMQHSFEQQAGEHKSWEDQQRISDSLVDELRAQVAELQQTLQEAQSEAAKLKSDYERASDTIAELEAQRQDAEQGASAQEELNADYEAQRQRWNQETEELRQSMQQLSVDLSDAKEELGQLKQANQELTDRLTEIQDQRDRALEEVEARPTQDSFDEIRQQLQQATTQLTALQQEHDRVLSDSEQPSLPEATNAETPGDPPTDSHVPSEVLVETENVEAMDDWQDSSVQTSPVTQEEMGSEEMVAPTAFELPPAESAPIPDRPVETQSSLAEIHDGSAEAQSIFAEAQSIPAEAHDNPTETHDSPAEAQSSPAEAQSSPAEQWDAPSHSEEALESSLGADQSSDQVENPWRAEEPSQDPTPAPLDTSEPIDESSAWRVADASLPEEQEPPSSNPWSSVSTEDHEATVPAVESTQSQEPSVWSTPNLDEPEDPTPSAWHHASPETPEDAPTLEPENAGVESLHPESDPIDGVVDGGAVESDSIEDAPLPSEPPGFELSESNLTPPNEPSAWDAEPSTESENAVPNEPAVGSLASELLRDIASEDAQQEDAGPESGLFSSEALGTQSTQDSQPFAMQDAGEAGTWGHQGTSMEDSSTPTMEEEPMPEGYTPTVNFPMDGSSLLGADDGLSTGVEPNDSDMAIDQTDAGSLYTPTEQYSPTQSFDASNVGLESAGLESAGLEDVGTEHVGLGQTELDDASSEDVSGAFLSNEEEENTGTDSVLTEPEYVESSHVIDDNNTTAEVPQGAESPAAGSEPAPDDDSIEAYMNRLLQRVQGGSSSTSADTVAHPKVSASTANEETANPETPEAVAEPEVPIDPNAPLVARSQAPEKNTNLSAMRQLANASARSAISRSVKLQTRDAQLRAMSKFLVAGVFLLCGCGVLVTAPQMWVKTLGVSAGIVAAFAFVRDGLLISRDTKRRMLMAEQEAERESEED